MVVSFKGRRHDPDEFYELVRSADFQIKFSCSAAVDKPDARTYVRSGKLQELKDLILKLLNNLIDKNSNHLFEPSFFPQEDSSYVSWVKRSLILLGWKIIRGKDTAKNLFDLFEKN